VFVCSGCNEKKIKNIVEIKLNLETLKSRKYNIKKYYYYISKMKKVRKIR